MARSVAWRAVWIGLILGGPSSASAAPEEASEGEDAPSVDEPTPDDPTPDEPTPPDDPPPEPVVIQLTPEALPLSALSNLAEDHQETAEADQQLVKELLGEAGLGLPMPGLELPFRSTPLIRPATTLLFAAPQGRLQAGLGLGISLGHRWFPMEERRVRWAGENRIDLQGMVGGVRGWRLALTAEAGPWIGPVGFRLGLRSDASRWNITGTPLSPSWLAGPQATFGANIGDVHPWVAFAPQWRLAGKREGISDGLAEWRGEAGLAVEGSLLWHRLSATARQTSDGVILGVGYGASFRPKFKSPDPDEDEDEAP